MDLERLDVGMEVNEMAQAGLAEEAKFLGKIHFKLDYDFQQNAVSYYFYRA